MIPTQQAHKIANEILENKPQTTIANTSKLSAIAKIAFVAGIVMMIIN